jgi:integrase|nr:Arm DNA-binding domain-containing protein [Ruminococcus sp. 1001713B170207_170306_F5]
MGVYKEGKNWKVQVYYKDWQGNRKRKQKRGFRTKGEAKEWERDFLQQQSQGVDIEFGNFLEIYYKDMDVRLRENTMYTKRYIIDLKIKPYFEKKILSEITVADVRAWQNELLTYKDKNGKGYSPTYLKTVNCQLTAIFNYAMRYYNLQDNPCRKAGAIGKSKGEPKDFWMQEEFNAFLETVSDKPETRMAFLLLYWTGMRIGDDDDKIRLNQRKPSKYKGLRRFGPEKNLQRINKFMKERPIFYKNLIQMKENIRFYLRCFYCITKVMILQFNSENRTELARNG